MLNVYSWLGWLFSVLSVVMLVKHGFDMGSFVAPLQLALDYYEGATEFLLGWARPYLERTLGCLLGWTGWELRLHSHWKHVFILMWLYTSADAISHWTFGAVIDGKKWRPRRPLAVTVAVLGAGIALLSGSGAGLVALRDPASNLLLAVAVVGGFVLYEFGFNALATTFLRDQNETWWSAFRSHSAEAVRLSIAGVAVLLLCTQATRISSISALPSPALAILAAAVISLAVYRVGVGILWAFRHRRLADRWSEVFELSISGPLGLRILKVVGGAVLFILTSAGLRW